MLAIFIILFILVLIYLSIEYFALNKAIYKIPLRILVNGTRGKTTTVNILYNIFRKSGIKVFAKTTGDLPLEHYPDGQQNVLTRFAPASIIENVKLLRKWAKFKPEAIILECMALHPENQFILSKKMFKPTNIIVTNILNDHWEVMGENIDTITQTICESFYSKAKIVLSENIKSNIYEEFDVQTYPEVMVKPTFINIPNTFINESWSLISKVCEVLELDKDMASIEFNNIWQQKNKNIKIENNSDRFEFWNLFSVNDYDSAKRYIELLLDNQTSTHTIEIVLNTRTDRPLRTKYFVSLLFEYFKNNKIYITGSGKSLAFRLLNKSGCQKIQTINSSDLLSKFNNGFEQFTSFIGFGNYKGMNKFITSIKSINNSEHQ